MKAKAKTERDFEALLNTLPYTLAELQAQKPADKVCAVKVFALVDMLAYILAKKKKKTLAANHGEMWRLRHCSRRWLKGWQK